MKIRVRYTDEGGPSGCEIVDAETGKRIEGVVSVSFKLVANNLPLLVLEVYPEEVSIEARAKLTPAECMLCGQRKPMSEQTRQMMETTCEELVALPKAPA